MSAKLKVGATALLLSFLMVEQASAISWYCPPVPEFDGSSGVAVLALLMSVGAVLFRGSKKA
jgi:hypothetical protein